MIGCAETAKSRILLAAGRSYFFVVGSHFSETARLNAGLIRASVAQIAIRRLEVRACTAHFLFDLQQPSHGVGASHFQLQQVVLPLLLREFALKWLHQLIGSLTRFVACLCLSCQLWYKQLGYCDSAAACTCVWHHRVVWAQQAGQMVARASIADVLPK